MLDYIMLDFKQLLAQKSSYGRWLMIPDLYLQIGQSLWLYSTFMVFLLRCKIILATLMLNDGHAYTAKRKPSKSFCRRSWRFFRLCLHVHITFLTSPSWSSCVINGFREFIIPRGSRISKRILSKFTSGKKRCIN